MARSLRPLLARLGRLAAQPLLLAQVAASLSGALVMVLAAIWMAPAQFVGFSLINLISVTSVGLVRAGLFQPALIQQRSDPAARTSFRQALLAAGAVSLVATGVTATVYQLTPGGAALLFAGGIFPILHDWVRFRAMSVNRRWQVLLADGTRLVLVAATTPLVLGRSGDPVELQAVLGAVLLVPLLVGSLRLPRVGPVAPLRSYRRAALLQLTDFAVGQFNTTVPLIVLGGLSSTATIAGVRFAQTVLGPLNLLFSASTANLITDAATDSDLTADRDLVARGSRLASRLGLLSVAVIVLLGGSVALTGFGLRGVPSDALLQGLLLVGAATAGSGWAGIHAILLRLLGRQGTATAGRTALVTASSIGYLVGYLLGGVDLSVTAGFLTAAVASPLAFVLPARRVYARLDQPRPRGHLSADDPGF